VRRHESENAKPQDLDVHAPKARQWMTLEQATAYL
jgi:hypothetical protein